MGLLKFLLGRQDEILSSINGINLTREDIIAFGDVVHDYSKIHRDIDEAKRNGFEDTPVIGVHLAAIGGRLSRDLISAIERPDATFFYTLQKVTFRDPIYPDSQINWNPPELEFDNEIISFHLVIPNQNPERKPRVDMHSEFRTSRPNFLQPNRDFLVYSEEIEITSKELERFYGCLREEPSKLVAFSLGIARVPSSILSFANELNKTRGTQIGGKNLEVISQAHDELQIGKARSDIYFVEKSGRGKRVSYIFNGVIYQNEKPIISSRVKTLA